MKKPKLRAYYFKDPTGTVAVVIAGSEVEARCLLEGAHPPAKTKPYTLQPLRLTRPAAHILHNGESV